MEKKKIRLYLGIDPTGSRLHLGHTIALRKLQQFAELGHEAILLIGTGTVLVGDPSQRSSGRPKITQEEIDENIKTWKQQAGKIIDFSKVQVKYNGEWLTKLSLKDLIEIASHIGAVQLFKREMFERRIEAGDYVGYHETLYPILQGYDSVVMDVDLEIGGTDQTFNMLIGRELQQKMNGREKYVLTVPMILGLDGKQMSKTSENCVWLDDDAQDMFGKIMSMHDNQIFIYMELVTDMPMAEIQLIKNRMQLNEMSHLYAKKRLAWEIVKTYHNEEAATKAKSEFESVFQKRGSPSDAPEISVVPGDLDIPRILMENKLIKSVSEAKRLLRQGAIEVDGKVISEPVVKRGPRQKILIKVGKHRFLRISTI